MKKLINVAFAYAIAAMAGGVFYREFTKWHGFNGVTALGKVHLHLFVLGMIVFLIAALSNSKHDPLFRKFFVVYNIGVPLTALMMVIRGIPQVLQITLPRGIDAAISGISGIGHIVTGIGLVLFLLALKKNAAD